MRAVTSSPLTRAFSPLLRNRVLIFMLHRFSDPERGVAAYDPARLRQMLEYLRAHRHGIIHLDELFRRLRDEGPPLHGAVAFTIDDGYYDQATVAAPIFAEFDCPVTTFVTSGFLDGEIWFWWDKVEFIFSGTQRSQLEVALGEHKLTLSLVGPGQRQLAEREFTRMCKEVADDDMRAAIEALAEAAEVELPAEPPPQYAPMSWAQLRSCERHEMSFGPHTVTHPILARTTDERSKQELKRSWSAESPNAVPIFCYPNGQPGDFGAREIRVLQELGFLGAVIGYPGYVDGTTIRQTDELAFTVPRFSMPPDKLQLIQLASGIERAKEILRGEGSKRGPRSLAASAPRSGSTRHAPHGSRRPDPRQFPQPGSSEVRRPVEVCVLRAAAIQLAPG